MRPRLITALALFVCTANGVWAQGGDPLKSPECKAALDELERRVEEKTEGAARAQRVASARRFAATACLGRSEGNARRSGAPDPPQVVRPPVITALPPAPPLPGMVAPPPPVPIPRPTVITTCDPAGCWDSEGRRLNNMGPLLMGPRGPCTVQGGLASCP
ncbi:MAG: hypothetical protein K0Q43_3397 [Ramlibacter sp.]|nr:hypothetical protein [Ramlibacter sp.]